MKDQMCIGCNAGCDLEKSVRLSYRKLSSGAAPDTSSPYDIAALAAIGVRLELGNGYTQSQRDEIGIAFAVDYMRKFPAAQRMQQVKKLCELAYSPDTRSGVAAYAANICTGAEKLDEVLVTDLSTIAVLNAPQDGDVLPVSQLLNGERKRLENQFGSYFGRSRTDKMYSERL
jgi:hypothetical protein